MLLRKRDVITTEIDDKIFNDFIFFYDMECKLHKRNRDRSSEYNDNVCENIGTLNPESLNTEQGERRIDYLFGSKSQLYATGLRIATFTSSCVIRYGSDVMNAYKKRCLISLEEFHTRRDVIKRLSEKHNTFWTYPLFIRAYNHFSHLSMVQQEFK